MPQNKEDKAVAHRKIGRPKTALPKPPAVPTGRYVECPGNRHSHEPRLVPILKGQKAYFYRCTCTANGFMSKNWEATQGYTLEQALAFTKPPYNWQVIGH